MELSEKYNKVAEMIENHNQALRGIDRCLSNTDEPEMQAITQYLLETEENPYCFLPEEWAGAMETTTGFYSLLSNIHHALYDDGAIIFPITYSGPQIVFSEKYSFDENPLDHKDKRVKYCKDVYDFIDKHKAYFRAQVRIWFLSDQNLGLEKAIEHYSKYSCFDKEWIKEYKPVLSSKEYFKLHLPELPKIIDLD